MYETDEVPESDDLEGVSATVIGGDGREIEYVRGLLADGADVEATGCLPEAEEIMGKPQTQDPAEAVSGVDVVLHSVVYITPEGYLFTPGWDEDIHQDVFRNMDEGSVLIIGTATDEIHQMAEEEGFHIHEYGDDDELMLLRAPTIVEGALKVAIEETTVSIHDSKTAVLGFGRMGFSVTRTVELLGAKTSVVARDRSQLSRARELGATPVHLDNKMDALEDARIVFNTIPVEILSEDVLKQMRRDAVIVDLASVPGGTDFDAAEELGINANLARGLGGRAPETAGRLQYRGIRQMIMDELDIDA